MRDKRRRLGLARHRPCSCPGSATLMTFSFCRSKLLSIKNSYFRPQIALTTPTEATKVVLHERDDCYQINFSDSFHIQIPLSNPLLFKSLALCLLNNQMINRRQAAQSRQLSEDRVGKLAKKLTEEDVVQDEWSKDNDIRMISTDMLRAWGKEIRTAAKKDLQHGTPGDH